MPADTQPNTVENVTDRTSNPFGMRAPCEEFWPNGPVGPHEHSAVFGYGDANADFHVIGDHPGVHGGRSTGVPFTDSPGGERIQRVLSRTGFAAETYADEPTLENCFLSYVHLCTPPEGESPTFASYAALERFFDAELRAINAHILLPVGDHATAHVLEEYTTQSRKLPRTAAAIHAAQIRGRGFLVVPIAEPADWSDDDEDRLVSVLDALLASDYRQTKGVPTMIG